MSTRINKTRKKVPEPRTTSKSTLFAVGAAVLAAIAIAIWAGSKALLPDPATPAESTETRASEPQPTAPETEQASDEAPRLFSESMLNAGDDEPEAPAQAEAQDEALNVPFELEQVAYALSRVEVDENGDIVINEAAQTVLEQAFLDARATMDEQQLEELKTMIAAGLDGQAGSQAAEIAEKFYRYSNAFREISDTLAVRGDPESLRKDYDQIARLRRTHLGPELADELYSREEKLTRYTLEVMEIQADEDLSPEQRSERQEELASRYSDVMPNGEEEQQRPEQTTN